MNLRLLSCVTSTFYFLHCNFYCCPVVHSGNQHKARSEQISLLFPLSLCSNANFAHKNKRRKSHRMLLYLICSFITLTPSPTNIGSLDCCVLTLPPPLPDPTAVTTFKTFSEQSSCHYRLSQINPLNFLFSERLSFPQLDSR